MTTFWESFCDTNSIVTFNVIFYFPVRKCSHHFHHPLLLLGGLCHHPGPLWFSGSGSCHLLPSTASHVCPTTRQSVQPCSKPLCEYTVSHSPFFIESFKLSLSKDQTGLKQKYTGWIICFSVYVSIVIFFSFIYFCFKF